MDRASRGEDTVQRQGVQNFAWLSPKELLLGLSTIVCFLRPQLFVLQSPHNVYREVIVMVSSPCALSLLTARWPKAKASVQRSCYTGGFCTERKTRGSRARKHTATTPSVFFLRVSTAQAPLPEQGVLRLAGPEGS